METNFNKWKEFDLLTAIIAIAGLALSIVEYEYSEWMAKAIVITENFRKTEKYCDPTVITTVSETDPDAFQFCA